MKRFAAVLSLISVSVLLLCGCAYYHPYGYDSYSYPDYRYGLIAPYYYYSPNGYYSYYPYPYTYPYGPYGAYYDYYPYPPYNLGESPGGYMERHFEPGGQPGGKR
jgi:hypothetical protein